MAASTVADSATGYGDTTRLGGHRHRAAHPVPAPSAPRRVPRRSHPGSAEGPRRAVFSLSIVNALIDDQGRRFDAIEDLYDVAGNPECNAQLQPGFKDEMLFVYRVTKDAKIALWEFEEYDLESEPNPTLVDLT
ncbi:hypothetical protein ACI2L1_02290 [Streptomyces sp. NPDC019531]|uniref:hypothetical protein n=1 Tax=Streptomyces sp. NPDC019531 TaxID=3365062 RepID=UPI00384B67B3